MWLFLSCAMAAAPVDPPSGGISPLAWAIIGALALAIGGAVPALWHRGNKIQDRMYEDLKTCNERKAQLEEDLLGLLKVLRLSMEQSRKR
jgi:hypothetical protein